MAEGIIRDIDVTGEDIYGLARKSLEKYITAIDSSNKDLAKQAELLDRITKSADTASKKGIDQLVTSRKKLEQVADKANKNDQERMKILKTEERLRKKLSDTVNGERDEIIKLQEENRRATKAARENIKATLDQGDAYETLKRDTNKAQLEFKRLATQFGVNSKEATEARQKFELLDQELREINNAAKDGRRDVGRYGDAIRGVRDTTLKWTAAITGAVFAVRGLFNAVNEQDQINKRLAASFDLTGEALDRVSKRVEFISKAYKVEVNEVIESANVLTNEFGIESDKAFGLIEQGFAKGANVRGEFLEQLKEYSTQFVNVGLNAEQAIAVITQQENRGVFSDKGIDAIKEAGIRLSEMPKATLDALAAIGFSGEEIQRQITTGQKTVFEVTQDISKEIAKLPPNAKEVGTVLADVFGGAGEDAKGFVLSLGDVSTELEDLEDTTTDFEKAQQEIIKQFIEIKQAVSRGLIPVFTFLASNFKTIILLFTSYAVKVAAARIANSKFGVSLKNVAAAFKKGETSGKRFTGGLKALGSALKSIGFTAAIAGALKLAEAFFDVASGARQARKDAELLNAVVGKFNDKINERLDLRKKELDQQLELAKTEKERKQLREDFIKDNQIEAAALQKQLDLNKERLKIAKEIADAQSGIGTMQMEAADQFAEFFGVEVKDAADIVGELEAKQAALEGGLITLNTATQDAKHELEVYNKEQREAAKTTGGTTKEVEEQAEAVEDLEEAYRNSRTEFEKQVDNASDIAKRRTKQFEKEAEELQENLTEQLIIITDFEREKVLTSDEANANTLALELKALKKRKELLIKYGQDKGDIDLQISQKSLELAKATSSDVIDVEKDENAQRLEARKELFDALEELGEKEIDNFIERSKRKQDALDQEISQIEKLEGALRDSANNQNALASESLAELESTKNEKIRQKQDEANKQAALEELKAAYAALNNFLDKGDDFASATAKSISGIKVFKDLVSSIASIPGFFKGTKNAPEGLAWTDEQGAEIHLDKHGNLKDWGSDGGPRLKKLEQGDQILTASESKARQTEILNRQLSGAAMLQNVSMNKTSSTDQSLLLEMRKLRQTINDKPEYSLHPILKNGVLVGLNEQQKRGNKIENFKTLTRS